MFSNPSQPAAATALPSRPLRVLRIGPSPIKALLAGIGFLAFALVAIWMAVQNLAPDYKIAAGPVPVNRGEVKGECTVRYIVFTGCTVNLHYTVDGRSYDMKRRFYWFDTSGGSYSASIVRSATQPELATIDIALERMWNRLAFALAFILFFGAVGVMGLLGWRKTGRLHRHYPSGKSQPLRLVRVAVRQQMAEKNRLYSYTLEADGKKYNFGTNFTKAEQGPLLTTQGEGVAVAALDAPLLPVLLDAQATRLDLTADERATLLRVMAGP